MMYGLLFSIASAASWEADTAVAVAGPAAPAERLGALQAALLAEGDADHRARLRDLLGALDRLAPLAEAERVALAQRILSGEAPPLPSPPPAPPEPWVEALLAQLAAAPSTATAELLLAEARRGQGDSVSAAARLDAAEALLGAISPVDAARSAKARELYADALSRDAAVRARADEVVRRTLPGELRLARLGLAPVERVRGDFRPTVVDGWWVACNTFDASSEWRWSDERPTWDVCGEGGVVARRRGWTIAVGGEPVEREEDLGDLSSLPVRGSCRAEIPLRVEARGVYSAYGAHVVSRRVMGSAPGRPQDCRAREEAEEEVAAASRALDEALAGPRAGGGGS